MKAALGLSLEEQRTGMARLDFAIESMMHAGTLSTRHKDFRHHHLVAGLDDALDVVVALDVVDRFVVHVAGGAGGFYDKLAMRPLSYVDKTRIRLE